MINKISTWAILSCFTLLMAYVVLGHVIGWPSQSLTYKAYTSGMWSLLGAAVLLVIIFVYSVIYVPRLKRSSFKILMGILVAGAIITEIVLAHALMSEGHAWDAGTINAIAQQYIDNGTTEIPDSWEQFYLAKYPNNIFITMLIVGAHNLTHLFGDVSLALSSQLLNSVTILATVFLMVFVALKLYGRRGALTAFGLGYLLIILSAYTPITYTDTIGAFFVSLSIFCAVMMSRAASYRRFVWGGMLGLALAMGYLIKPTILIILVALTLVFCVRCFSQSTTRKRHILIVISSVISGLLVGYLGFHSIWYALPRFAHYSVAEVSRYETTQWQFLAMGSLRGLEPYTHCKSGGFCAELVEYMQSGATTVDTVTKRKAYSQELWRNNIKRDFPFGATGLMLKKTLLTYSDGSFGVWGEGAGLNSRIKFYNNSSLDQKIREFAGPTGEFKRYYKIFLQTIWLCTLLIIMMGTIVAWRQQAWRKDVWRNVFTLSILGVTAFLLLFESRSRYLFLFLPIFILLATGSLKTLSDEFKNSRIAKRLNLMSPR